MELFSSTWLGHSFSWGYGFRLPRSGIKLNFPIRKIAFSVSKWVKRDNMKRVRNWVFKSVLYISLILSSNCEKEGWKEILNHLLSILRLVTKEGDWPYMSHLSRTLWIFSRGPALSKLSCFSFMGWHTWHAPGWGSVGPLIFLLSPWMTDVQDHVVFCFNVLFLKTSLSALKS